jgi:hypothetical protein
MNILVLAPHPFFQNRGTPIAVKLLLTALSENGHRVDVLTYPEGQDVSLRNVTIIRVQRTLGIDGVPIGFSLKKVFYDILLLFRMLALLRTNRYDLIHAVEESAFIAIAGKILYKIPYVFDMDSSIPDQIIEKYPGLRLTHRVLRRIERIMIRRSIFVVAVCESSQRSQGLAGGESRGSPGGCSALFLRDGAKSLGIAKSLTFPVRS